MYLYIIYWNLCNYWNFLKFIVVYVCIEVECIYSNCFSTVFIGPVFIANLIYLFIFIELDLIFYFFIQYM